MQFQDRFPDLDLIQDRNSRTAKEVIKKKPLLASRIGQVRLLEKERRCHERKNVRLTRESGWLL